MIPRLLSALSLVLALAAPAAASVVTEADGQFSRHWKTPTAIGPGVDTILGTAERQNGHEFLALTGLTPGAQILSFVFTAPAWALSQDSYSAGGQVLWKDRPFQHGWDGISAGSFQLSRWTPESALEIILGEDFQGPLQLGIYFTHGRDVSWSVAAGTALRSAQAPSVAAAVPLPASVAYSLGGLSMLAALGLWGGSRRRALR